jgi:hypothetical protein
MLSTLHWWWWADNDVVRFSLLRSQSPHGAARRATGSATFALRVARLASVRRDGRAAQPSRSCSLSCFAQCWQWCTVRTASNLRVPLRRRRRGGVCPVPPVGLVQYKVVGVCEWRLHPTVLCSLLLWKIYLFSKSKFHLITTKYTIQIDTDLFTT